MTNYFEAQARALRVMEDADIRSKAYNEGFEDARRLQKSTPSSGVGVFLAMVFCSYK